MSSETDAVSQPRFTHDCLHCVFLGEFGHVDLYFHPGDKLHRTVIARRSNAPSDYESGLHVAEHHPAHVPALAEARKRAIARGLLKETPNE